MKTCHVALVLALVSSHRLATADDGERRERERIARERAAATARYAEQERECRTRFVVTPCIENAQAERRETMEHLRAQQRVLDEADRKRRAAERMQAIRDRIEQAPGTPPPMEIAAPRGEAASAAAASAAGQAGHRPRAKRPPLESAERAEREQAARERYEERQREGEQRREENARRNAERRKPGSKPAASLPVPDDLPAPAASPASR